MSNLISFISKHSKAFIVGAMAGMVLAASIVAVPAVAVRIRSSVVEALARRGVGVSQAEAGAGIAPSAVAYENAVIEAVKKASPAVVAITVSKNVGVAQRCTTTPLPTVPPEFQEFFNTQFPEFSTTCDAKTSQQQQVGGGSGFIISSDGLIVTNKHVVRSSEAAYTVFTNEGKKYDATVVAIDPVQDLAVLRISATGLPTLKLGDSSSLQLGQTAIAIGNALGEYRNTVSTGVISGLGRNVSAAASGSSDIETIQGVIQTDTAINPGNSGGPLLNLRGEVIGINTAVALAAQNIGFALPINAAKRAITSVRQRGSIESPYLGVRYQLLDRALATEKGIGLTYGALVGADETGHAVVAGSPAEKAGVRAGDIIYEVNGTRVDTEHPLANTINSYTVGEVIRLSVYRGGNALTVPVTLARRP